MLRKTLFLIILFFFLGGNVWGDEKLCEKISLKGRLDPPLREVEKRLVCGDSEQGQEVPNEGWKKIPFSQAQYNLRNYLQSRGYHFPIFQVSTDSSKVTVEVGRQTLVRRIQVIGDEGKIPIDRKRKVIGEPLTPGILALLEKWAFEQLQFDGYGCPQVTSQANPATGEVTLNVSLGLRQMLSSVTQEPIEGVLDNILRRYDAFQIGSQFNGMLLNVSDRRVEAAQLVESTRFSVTCENDGIHLKQVVVSGAPRLITVGVGINTEGILLGKVSWKNSRLGRTASLIDVTADSSAQIQSIQGTSNWYFRDDVSKMNLNTVLSGAHRNELHFEALTTSLQTGLSTAWDFLGWGGKIFIGPDLSFYKTLSGFGSPSTRVFSLAGKIQAQSHDYEFYSGEPRSGWNISLGFNLSHQELLSEISAQKIQLRGEKLWNIARFDPPFLVLGLRGQLISILTGEIPGMNTRLPAPYLQYLGGSRDLRGFSRLELPTDPVLGGGVTSALLSVELRLSHVLPAGFDPFIFMDVGALGYRSLGLDLPVYGSPGFGIRWASPVGALRTTLAHGWSGRSSDHWQFYLSLGEEF